MDSHGGMLNKTETIFCLEDQVQSLNFFGFSDHGGHGGHGGHMDMHDMHAGHAGHEGHEGHGGHEGHEGHDGHMDHMMMDMTVIFLNFQMKFSFVLNHISIYSFILDVKRKFFSINGISIPSVV